MRAGTPQETAAFGQVILFAVPYSAFPELIKSLGNSLKGKVVINASNPFPQRDGEIASQAREDGAGLFDAHLLPGAFVVRAFNAVGAARMASARHPEVKYSPAQIVTTTQLPRLPTRLRAKAFCEVLYSPTRGDEAETDSIAPPAVWRGDAHVPRPCASIQAGP
jgi:hypothetical protein